MIQYLSKIIKFDKLNVVGVIKKENDENYYVLSIQKKGNKIAILSNRFFSNFEEFSSRIETKLPVLLVIDGKGVLNKKIDFNNETDLNWQKNIDFNTIYYTKIKSEYSNFISFSRKSNIQDTITKFQNTNFQLIDVYLGSFISCLLYDSIEKEIIHSGDLLLTFKDKKLIDFSKIEIPKRNVYTISKDDISNEVLPLYGAVIDFFLKTNEVEKTKIESLNSEEFIYKKAFNYFGIFTLVFFLTSLLISYLFLQYYGAKIAELNIQNVYSSQSYKKLKALEKEKEKQLVILNQSGALSPNFLTNYTYDLVKDVPAAVKLTEINCIPIDKEVKTEKRIGFDTNIIFVQGQTLDETSINNWLERLKKISWIKKFEIVNLKKDKKNVSQFEIKINIK